LNGKLNLNGDVERIVCGVCNIPLSKELDTRILAKGSCVNCENIANFVEKNVRILYNDTRFWSTRLKSLDEIEQVVPIDDLCDMFDGYWCKKCDVKFKWSHEMVYHVRKHIRGEIE